jgi:hypothetical protein
MKLYFCAEPQWRPARTKVKYDRGVGHLSVCHGGWAVALGMPWAHTYRSDSASVLGPQPVGCA